MLCRYSIAIGLDTITASVGRITDARTEHEDTDAAALVGRLASNETREGGTAKGMVKRGEISSICVCYVAPADTALQGESWEQALTRAEEVGAPEREVEQRLGR